MKHLINLLVKIRVWDEHDSKLSVSGLAALVGIGAFAAAAWRNQIGSTELLGLFLALAGWNAKKYMAPEADKPVETVVVQDLSPIQSSIDDLTSKVSRLMVSAGFRG